MPSQQPLVMQRLLSVASSSNSLVQPNDRVVKRRRNHHTALDWESKKPTIIQLYITENKRVEDVIEILKSDFAFNTSPRRFLEETTKWGIRKNKRRDAKYVQNVQEDPGEENSAPELDDVAFGTAGFSSDLVIHNIGCSHSPDISELSISGLPNSHLSAALSQPQQPLCSCVGISPTSQLLQYQDISLEEMDLGTPRLPMSWRPAHASSPQCTDLAGPSTTIVIRSRAPSPTTLEVYRQPPSKVQDVFPASHQTLPETTISISRRPDQQTSQIFSSLENGIHSVIKFTSKEGIISDSNIMQLKGNLRLLLDLARSSIFCRNSFSHDIYSNLHLVNSLISAAPKLAINADGSLRFPRHLLPNARIKLQYEHTRAYIGTRILDISTTTSKIDLAQSDQDDYAYTSVAIILRPKDSALALRIEANQCQFVGGSFLSTPRLSINNVVPSSSAVFEVAAKGSVQDLKALFASGQANIRDHDENGWSLLHHSLRNPPVCRFLIQSGLDVDELCYLGGGDNCLTPLHISHYHFKNVETTRFLLVEGADPTIRPRGKFSVADGAASSLSLESFSFFCDILNLSSHFLIDGGCLLPWVCQPEQHKMPQSDHNVHPVKKMELLLTKGVRINAKCGELNCLGNFIRSIRWVLLEDWFSLLVYAIQHGADVYCADESGVTVSQLAYTESIYMYSGCDLGSYRGDLWDAVLHASGYDISEFRAACPRRARYTQDYARKDFELLWKGREHLCPYWEDNEWPAAPKPDQGFIDPCTSSHHQDLYRYRPPMTCPFYHISPVYSGSERSVAYRDDTPHADGRKGEGCHAREIKGNEGITSQVIEGLPSPHDFPESVSSDDTEMEDFFRGVGGLFDPTMFDV